MVTRQQRAEMVKWVKEILGPLKAVQWWTTPNPMLGDITPCSMTMWAPHEERLYRFIKGQYEDFQLNRGAPNG